MKLLGKDARPVKEKIELCTGHKYVNSMQVCVKHSGIEMCEHCVTCNCVQVIIYGATNPKGHEVQAGALLIHHPYFSQAGIVVPRFKRMFFE